MNIGTKSYLLGVFILAVIFRFCLKNLEHLILFVISGMSICNADLFAVGFVLYDRKENHLS